MCDSFENIAIIIMDNVNKLNSKCHIFTIKSLGSFVQVYRPCLCTPHQY